MHIAEVVTIAKSLPLLRLNTYKSLILSYSADYRRIFWKKATKEGALASLWTGALASLFAMLFLHKAEAGAVGLCNMLSGRDVLIDIYPWFAIDPILFALPLSTVAMVLTSLITYKKQEI